MGVLLDSRWDRNFLDMARLVSTWSKDPSTRVGAVIVRPDKTIASVGFNGFPMGCSDAPEIYLDRERKLQRVVHAEVNAILLAQEKLHGYYMYVWPPSSIGPTCDRCAGAVIQAGIAGVAHMVPSGECSFGERWRASLEEALAMYDESGVVVARISE